MVKGGHNFSNSVGNDADMYSPRTAPDAISTSVLFNVILQKPFLPPCQVERIDVVRKHVELQKRNASTTRMLTSTYKNCPTYRYGLHRRNFLKHSRNSFGPRPLSVGSRNVLQRIRWQACRRFASCPSCHGLPTAVNVKNKGQNKRALAPTKDLAPVRFKDHVD